VTDLRQEFAKKCSYALLVSVLAIGIVALAVGNNFVLAQPCTAQLGSPTTSVAQYYQSNFQVTVPVSAACPFYAGQLYAQGTAYDTTYNSNVATANTALTSYGGSEFSGQLQFNLPTTVESHTVQLTVSIYSTQTGYEQGYYGNSYYAGSLLTTTSTTFIPTLSYYQNGYQNYPTYPNSPTYPSYPSYPGYSNYYPGGQYYYNPYSSYYYYHNGYYNNYYYYRYHNGYYSHCSPSSYNHYCHP